MKTYHKNFVLIFIGCLLAVSAPVYAAGLEVVFEATPLFSEAKIVPGDSVSRTIKVTNNNPDSENIEVLATNVFNGGLASELNLSVTAPGESYFSGNLEQFFTTASPLSLGALAPQSSRTYTFTASLPTGTGNAFMLKNTGFDLVIGFVGGEQVIDNPTSRSSSGGGSGLTRLSLFNELATDVSVASASAVVTWNSNLEASSYLVCGKVSDGPYALSSEAPLFGYQFSVPEVTTKSVVHSLTVSGLDLVDYECRPAGRRSEGGLFTIGQPVQFGFPGPKVAGAATTAGQNIVEDVSDGKAWPGRVLGDQISRWPLGGLALGNGRLSILQGLILGIIFLTLTLFTFTFIRRRKRS